MLSLLQRDKIFKNGRTLFRVLPVFLWLVSFPAFAQTDLVQIITKAGLTQTQQNIRYDGQYFNIPYPNGDVPADVGVCTDVIIRSYRAAGIDLQKLVHEDMKAHFALYPKFWGLKKTDTNIDHRRVPNLQVFFKRFGETLPVTDKGDDYKAGDLVTWNLNQKGSLPHIGLVSDKRSADGLRPMMVHNIGRGVELEDMLFDYNITGHYRYLP